MARAADFWLNSAQASIFAPHQTPVNTPIAMGVILGGYAARYSAPPEAISFPGMPLEMPRAILKSASDAWSINVFLNRIDSHWKHLRSEPVVAPASERQLIVGLVEPLLAVITASPSLQIGRVAFVINRICQTADAARYLVDRFCDPSMKDPENPKAPFKRSGDFQIHNHKQYDLPGGFTVNSWVRCLSAKLESDGSVVIAVEQDLNSPQENIGTPLTPESIQEFFNLAHEEMKNILNLYFPD